MYYTAIDKGEARGFHSEANARTKREFAVAGVPSTPLFIVPTKLIRTEHAEDTTACEMGLGRKPISTERKCLVRMWGDDSEVSADDVPDEYVWSAISYLDPEQENCRRNSVLWGTTVAALLMWVSLLFLLHSL